MVPIGAALLSLLAAQAPVPPPIAPPPPEIYVCAVNRQAPGGGAIAYSMRVPVDGSRIQYRLAWTIASQPGRFFLMANADSGEPIDARRPDGRFWYSAAFYVDRPVHGEARIEIRRNPGDPFSAEFALAGAFQPMERLGESATWRISTIGHWDDLRAWLAGRPGLSFALVRRDVGIAAEARVDAALVEESTAAVAQARAEAEAMAGDYRHRCAKAEPGTAR